MKKLMPLTDRWDWQLLASCRYLGPQLFFGNEGESRDAKLRRERKAKEICELCPVRQPCQDHATHLAERYGVWGGTAELDRRPNTPRADPARTQMRSGQMPLRVSTSRPRPGRHGRREGTA
ncbi:WhiB family transcriptional regulator [Rhodococcus sp. IEGM 1318]|uniref:WhiB family transcriptional regulator n=1 Tax=Rhodococcus sp. IEGM 1318 TaxID=3082226 RepID=UPI00295333AA|nr:WhiB family transcriptional regulator [Rhodococcus sp. IEGM 1318]MDV8009553.1 WhiB family transcriptional regulator [Rhodococcus sp. IEGM 1318]